jgi:branched-chain amino acid transport system permease protein
MGQQAHRNPLPQHLFVPIVIVGAGLVFFGARAISNDYVFFAGYTVLQYIVLATAWNILGGYTGYVNFGSAAFFAMGAYATVFLHKVFLNETFSLSVPVLIVIRSIPFLMVVGAVVSGLVGFGMGYLTLRLRGAFFAIATLALAVVLQTFVVNWDYVGGSRGAYIIRPSENVLTGPYIQYLFLLMLGLVVLALVCARGIERSRLGYGFAAIRDDELAAEACGVPTLRLKLVATTLSGALMGMAGAPFPYYIGYLQPSSAFGLDYAVNSIAMPMIGGTTNWVGPLIGAILLGSLQQIATVTISSAVNLLVVGLLLVGFVIMAPNGIVGIVQEFLGKAGVNVRSLIIVTIAAFFFVGGLSTIILGLVMMMTGGAASAFVLGVVVLLFAGPELAAAYGLLVIRQWGLWLNIVLFALSIPFGLVWLFTGSTLFLAALQIAINALLLLFLLRTDVRALYQNRKAVG